LAVLQSETSVAANAAVVDIGANLSVDSPASELVDAAGGVLLDGAAEAVRLKSLKVVDEGTSAGGFAVRPPNRNRSKRNSMMTTSMRRKNAGEATSNFDLRTRGVHQGPLR
jgi:hypothetical protein